MNVGLIVVGTSLAMIEPAVPSGEALPAPDQLGAVTIVNNVVIDQVGAWNVAVVISVASGTP